jgi:hypothetical protein
MQLDRLHGHEQRLRYVAVGRLARRALAHSPLRGRRGVLAGQPEPRRAAARRRTGHQALIRPAPWRRTSASAPAPTAGHPCLAPPALIDQLRSQIGQGVRMLQPGRRRLDRRHGLPSSPRSSSPPTTRPAARSERASTRGARRPAPPSGGRPPAASLARRRRAGQALRPPRSATRSGGRSRRVRRRATHRSPERGSSTRPNRRFGCRSRHRPRPRPRHHRHVLHLHFIAGRAPADRWLGQHPADTVLELDDAHEAPTRRDPLLHGLAAPRRAPGHKTLPASLSVD